MKALKAGAVVLLGVGSVLAGCQGGFRESVTPGVMTSTPPDHPESALNHKATLAYWSGLEKALKLARQLRRTPPRERTRLPGGRESEYNYDDSVLKANYRYVSGIANLHAVAGAADEYRAIMGEEPPRRGKHGRSCRTDCTTGIAGSG